MSFANCTHVARRVTQDAAGFLLWASLRCPATGKARTWEELDGVRPGRYKDALLPWWRSGMVADPKPEPPPASPEQEALVAIQAALDGFDPQAASARARARRRGPRRND
jgi:hypothetical protein